MDEYIEDYQLGEIENSNTGCLDASGRYYGVEDLE